MADPRFSRAGCTNFKLGLFCKFFAENCMKMKDFGPARGHASLVPPLDPPVLNNLIQSGGDPGFSTGGAPILWGIGCGGGGANIRQKKLHEIEKTLVCQERPHPKSGNVQKSPIQVGNG